MRGVKIRGLRLFAVLAFAAVALPVFPAGRAIPDAAIDAIVSDALKAWQAPGASIVVVRDGQVVYLKGFGVRRLGSREAVTPETLFALASTTKAFTTTAMAMLVDEGRMSWDDPVRKHVEFFHLMDPLADANVTLRDLVTHHTGLGRHDLLWYGSPWSREDVIRRIGFVKPSWPFRSGWHYSNIMFMTAGYAVGTASGSTWENFVQKRIFDPLSMAGADFSSAAAQQQPDHSWAHLKEGGTVRVIEWPNVDNGGPCGSINSGAADLGRWLRFQLAGGMFEDKRLVSEKNLAETRTPQIVIRRDVLSRAAEEIGATQVSYGMGWSIQDYRGHLLVDHGGGIDGFSSNVSLFPKDKLGIAVLANVSPSSLPVSVRNRVADALLGLPAKDWNEIYLDGVRHGEELAKKREEEREAKRHKDTRPSLELAAYAGEYRHPAYGVATITLQNNTLVLHWANFDSRLEHYHFDTFTVKDGHRFANEQTRFALGMDGDVFTMDLLEQTFTKVKPKER